MTELRSRVIEVQVDTIKIKGVSSPGLRVVCKATKTLKPEPNKCDLKIYNLSPESRAGLTKVARPVVSVTAGYKGQTTQIFYGQALHVRHERVGTAGEDILTTISTSDSGEKTQKARVKVSFGANAKAGDVLRAIAKALSVKPGNLNDAIRKLNSGKAASIYAEGVVLSGHAPIDLTALCRSAGLEWSIQDGALQILDVGKALASTAIVLDASVLKGTPSISSKNVAEGVTFLQRDILPGRQVQIDHEFARGTFRLEKCEYTIDSYYDDWLVAFEAKGPPPK